jgi:hypothetical protein
MKCHPAIETMISDGGLVYILDPRLMSIFLKKSRMIPPAMPENSVKGQLAHIFLYWYR